MAWLDRLRAGLTKTRSGLADGLTSLLRGRAKLTEEDLERVEEILIAGDVGGQLAVEIAAELAEAVRRDRRDPLEILKEMLLERLGVAEESPLVVRGDGEPTVVLVVGVNGVGKTTTIAKLAAHLKKESPDLPLIFAAADTFRAAAVEQLAVWAERIGADIVRQQQGADPAAVAFDAIERARRTGGVLFIDTAGRLQTKHNLMEELKKVERTVTKRLGRPADARLLVLDATTGQNGIPQAERFHEAVELTGIVLTKLDGTAKGGVIFAVGDRLGVPIQYIGVGESAEDLHPFEAAEFVDALFAT